MSRSHLLAESLKDRPAAPGVWRMAMTLVGFCFGVRGERPR